MEASIIIIVNFTYHINICIFASKLNMKRYITTDDFRDVYIKAKQRGLDFVLSKFTFSETARTKSAFNETKKVSADWWSIPYVTQRWNSLITGKSDQNYEEFLLQENFAQHEGLSLLSIGSGESSREMRLAKSKAFQQITCLDLSDYRMNKARHIALEQGLTTMEFICANIYEHNFKHQVYDYVLFNASLHHFKEIPSFLKHQILPLLATDGKLIINEFVGATRLQFPNHQLKAINQALQLIPHKCRKRLKTSLYKKSYSGSGIIRMILADPSECIDSERILPSIHQLFDVEFEKGYGGNILANVLKDIAHHFHELDPENKQVLDALFAFEDKYLEKHPSDFVFGIYKKKKLLHSER